MEKEEKTHKNFLVGNFPKRLYDKLSEVRTKKGIDLRKQVIEAVDFWFNSKENEDNFVNGIRRERLKEILEDTTFHSKFISPPKKKKQKKKMEQTLELF